MTQVQFKNTKMFFDRFAVQLAITRAKAKQLNRTGATIRQIARRSMKKAPKQFTKSGKRKKLTRHGRYREIQSGKRKGQMRFQKGKSSPPGKPPYYHDGNDKNLRSIVYQWDGKDSVSVFTEKTNGSNYMTKPIPILQEVGGSAKGKSSRGPARRYPARPYMSPAGIEGLKFLRKNIKNSIKR